MRSHPPVLFTAFLCALCFLGGVSARATQTDNHGLHAVPAPGPVTIDGSLRDWDLSGQTLMCYDIETLQDIYSARVALMYDADALYVGIHWKDPKPMLNHHDPHYQADKGWAADCVQLRFKTDRIAHITAWYYSDKKEPAINLDYGKSLTEAFGGGSRQLFQTQGWHLTDGAEMAFQKDADGKGYVQEIKLPWALITQARTPRAGDKMQCGVELLWGSADWPEQRYADNLMPGKSSREFFWDAHNDWGPVILEPKGRLHLPTPDYLVKAMHPAAAVQGPVPISYVLPKDGRVTLVINDGAGKRIRNLIPAMPRTRGRNVERWDGLDDDGKPVLPGPYQARVLYHDPLRVNYAVSFASPGNPSWNTSDGRGAFYGDHTPPHSVAASGEYVGLACPMGEAGNPLIGCDLNGQRLWGQANREAFSVGISALATDGKTLWVGSDGKQPIVYRNEVATGLYAPWNQTATDDQGNKYQVLDLPVGAAAEKDDKNLVPDLTALSYRNGILAVCLSRENKIALLDSETGAVKQTLTVAQPKAVVLDTDGSLVVLSQGRLLRLTGEGKSTPFTDASYPDGYGIAMDSQRSVYLSVRGADQNVKVFSPDGKLIREIGRRGGRPAYGSYDPTGMLNPAGIAMDSKDRLWVTEENDNPKRTSVWTADGTLVKDLVGTTHYAAAGFLNPFDPTMAFSDNTVYTLDWTAGTYQPTYSLSARPDLSDLFPPTVNSTTNRVLRHGADTLVYASEGWHKVTSCAVLRDGRWRSAAALGEVLNPEELRHNQYAPADLVTRFSNSVFAGHVGEAFAWSDRNGDGLVQPDEIAFAPVMIGGKRITLHSTGWGQLPDENGTVVYYNPEAQALIKFPVTGYTQAGAPTYDVAHPQIVPVDQPLVQDNEGMLMAGTDGVTYLNQDPLMAVDKSGHVLWTYPSHVVGVHGSHNAKAAKPGYLIGPNSILGVAELPGAGEVFDMNGNLGENYLFTQDGFFVQSLFKDTRAPYQTPDRAVRGMPLDDISAGGESFGGNFVRTTDGHVYLTIGGTDARVLEVSGLDTLHRLPPMTFTYTPKQYQAAQALLQQQAAASNAPKVYVIARAAAPPAIDGKPAAWPELADDKASMMEVQESQDQRYARVAARYDDQNLYLAYRVFAPADHPRNAGQDTRLLFKTGDAVDLMLGPASSPTGAGNLRLLMTVAGGKPLAVLNEKTVPAASPRARYAFTAPWHSVTFDRVQTAPQVELATGPMLGGYFVGATIPWPVLGIQPAPGLKLKGDVGVLFADTGGTVTVSRQYWSNKATGLVNDVPGEADLTPALWGTFVLQ